MLQVQSFVFNAFQENTYLIFDEETKECFILDPGCSNHWEKQKLTTFIQKNGLQPTRLLLTHAHIDHILGNKFVFDTYGLLPECHESELPMIQNLERIGQMYGVPTEPSPLPKQYINDNESIQIGSHTLTTILAPGHSVGSLCFYCEKEKWLIGGDVLFRGSIGRTDLPGGNHHTLLESIEKRLFTLPDDISVYSGHGEVTTIGYEKVNNPFF